MKKKIFGIILFLSVIFAKAPNAYAAVGQMGFFGGINEGVRLPKTTEVLLSDDSKKKTEHETIYKEMIFISGRPVEFEGLLRVKGEDSIPEGSDKGTYKVTYEVGASDSSPEDIFVDRQIVFNVNYRVEKKQTIKDYSVSSWSETLTVGGNTYTLDPKQSFFDVNILEDKTAGVTYYKGDVSQKAVFMANDMRTTIETYGSLYGYDCAWSSSESHRLDVQIDNDEWQMQYQIRPAVTVNKELQYSKNEPEAISFEGNYQEIMQNKSGLQYNVYTIPVQFYDIPISGGVSIATHNTFEQLPAPDTNFLKGHPAESDIKKLFAMEILEDYPKFYKPEQALTRAQFVTMLTKAIKLPIAKTEEKKASRKTEEIKLTFPDVPSNRPDYPYIMAAYEAGLAIGRGNGYFYGDYSIEREEALVILLRTLGLSNLGLDPTPVTPFTDDAEISDWAKKDLYAAYKLGIIMPDEDGNIRPHEVVSKAEGSALVNRLLEYMRTGLRVDYTDNIVNYSD